MASRKIAAFRLERLPGAKRRATHMKGLRVLVLGQRYDFICREAVRQGAAQIVQLLDDPAAQKPDGRIFRQVEICCGDLTALGSERFDAIFLPDAHSHSDLPGFLDRIASHLAPKGVLVMEIALGPSATVTEWVQFSDATSTRRYPSARLLETVLLADYALRRVGRGVFPNPDQVPQAIYHCTPLLSTALIITGKSGHGKSNLVRHFNPHDFPAVATDNFLSRLARGKTHPDSVLVRRIIAEIGADSPNWGDVGRMIAAEPELVDEFCTILAESCPLEAPIFILEGEILRHDVVETRLIELLKTRSIRVWTMKPETG